MRIAIVHDWLDTWGGSENVLAALVEIYPNADLFAVVDFMSAENRSRLGRRRVVTSFIQNLPFARRHFRKYFALMPLAVERFDLSGYDVVISNSHAVAKGALVRDEALHVCLCYSPARYAWDLQEQYLEIAGFDRGITAWLVRLMLKRFRSWDLRRAAGVDRFVAISNYIASRIERCYRRTADVIYPPVALAASPTAPVARLPFYLTVSRLVPYKRVDVLVRAFAEMPRRELIVVGDGPEMKKLAAAAPSNIRFLGQVADDERNRLLASARAFVFAAEEDFGIAPLEAQACGTPVIAFSGGGAAETIRGLDSDAPTGVFFSEQTAPAIRAAVNTFEQNSERITAGACRANALRFSPELFRQRFADYVSAALEDRRLRPRGPRTC